MASKYLFRTQVSLSCKLAWSTMYWKARWLYWRLKSRNVWTRHLCQCTTCTAKYGMYKTVGPQIYECPMQTAIYIVLVLCQNLVILTSGSVVAVVVWLLDLQLPMQSLPITTDVVSLNLDQGEVYNIMW
jgi:hypothetical protein